MTTDLAGFEALADPTRRRIFEALRDSPRSVGELADRMPVSRPAVSQHLRVLRDAGLVTVSAQGTRRIHAVDRAGVLALRDYLDRFWTAALADFAAAVTAPAAATGDPDPGGAGSTPPDDDGAARVPSEEPS